MNTPHDTFVLVSDDELLIRAHAQAVCPRGTALVVPNVAEALRACSQQRVVGIIVDGALVKQQVAAQLAKIRAAHPLANVMFVATQISAAVLNELQPLRVELVVRPLPANTLALFVERTLSAGRLSHRHIRAWVQELASECRLTANDLALLPLVLEEEGPEETCARLQIDRATLSRGLRRLVKKCRVRNTDRLAKNVYRDALLYSREATVEMIEPLSQRAASF